MLEYFCGNCFVQFQDVFADLCQAPDLADSNTLSQELPIIEICAGSATSFSNIEAMVDEENVPN